jgi:hypothetical protein
MRATLSFQVALAAGLVLTACGEEVAPTVVSPGAHRCGEGQNIAIEASKETFKITGPCGKILVKGADNKLTVESAKSVDVDGPRNRLDIDFVDVVKATSAGNTITYKRGLTRPTSNAFALGDNNTIIQSTK